MCLADMKKEFDKVPRKFVELAFTGALVRLYEGAKTKVKVGTQLSEEFEVNIGVHHG